MTAIPENSLATLRRNLDALHAVDAPLAETLSTVVWPEDIQFLNAFDDTPTARAACFGRSGWFALSGAPKVRESVVTETFAPGTSNVILPAAGQGYGIRCLLERFEPCQSFFIWEANPLHVAVLLSLYDFSADLARRRLFFIVNPDLAAGLCDCLSRHPDIVFPEKMMPWPWISENAIQDITRTIEQAINRMTPVCSQKAGELEKKFLRLLAGDQPRESILVASLGLEPLHRRLAQDYAHALQSLNLPVRLLTLDRPAHASAIGILQFMIEQLPRVVISIGLDKKRWVFRTPPELSFLSVLTPPGMALPEQIIKDLTPAENEIFILGSREDGESLGQKCPAEKRFVLELAVNPADFVPRQETSKFQVLLLADRPDPDPEKNGIRQHSHRTLWNRLADLVAHSPLAYHDGLTAGLVQQASRQTGVAFTDPELLETFTSRVRSVLAPAVVAQTFAGLLAGSGLRFQIVGTGWDKVPEFAGFASPVPRDPAELCRTFHQADLLVYLDNGSNFRQMVLDALCAGRCVLIKKIPEDRLRRFPRIFNGVTVLDPDAGPITQLKSGLANLASLRGRAAQSRDYLLAHHSLPAALQQLLGQI